MKQNDAMAEILATSKKIKDENKVLRSQIASNANNGQTVFANLSKSGKSWICDLDEIKDMFGSGKLYIQKTTRKSGDYAGTEILTIKKVAGSSPNVADSDPDLTEGLF